MEIKVFSYRHKAYQFSVVCRTWNCLNSYWAWTAGMAQADLRLLPLTVGWTPSPPLVMCCCHFTCASSAHTYSAAMGEWDQLADLTETFLLQGLFSVTNWSFRTAHDQAAVGACSCECEYSPRFWQHYGLRQASAACGVVPGCLCCEGYIKTVSGQLIKPPLSFSQNKIVGAAQTLFFML